MSELLMNVYHFITQYNHLSQLSITKTPGTQRFNFFIFLGGLCALARDYFRLRLCHLMLYLGLVVGLGLS
jgi:hypothetical protein